MNTEKKSWEDEQEGADYVHLDGNDTMTVRIVKWHRNGKVKCLCQGQPFVARAKDLVPEYDYSHLVFRCNANGSDGRFYVNEQPGTIPGPVHDGDESMFDVPWLTDSEREKIEADGPDAIEKEIKRLRLGL
jgi:hypothetical protein